MLLSNRKAPNDKDPGRLIAVPSWSRIENYSIRLFTKNRMRGILTNFISINLNLGKIAGIVNKIVDIVVYKVLLV